MGRLLRDGIEVIMDKFEDNVLVVIKGLYVTVKFEEMRGHFILQIIEL